MGFFVFLGIVIGIVIAFIVASEFSSIASEKGYDGTKYFWYTLFLGIVGALMVIALPNRNSKINIVQNVPHTSEEYTSDNTSSGLTNKPNTPKNSTDTEYGSESVASSHEKNTTYKTTDQNTIICSSCGFEQPEGRAVCWKCGCKFGQENKID